MCAGIYISMYGRKVFIEVVLLLNKKLFREIQRTKTVITKLYREDFSLIVLRVAPPPWFFTSYDESSL